MEAPLTNSKLVLWDVPFAQWQGLSVSVITEAADGFIIVIAPLSENDPIENYPKFLIRFEQVLTLLTYDETCAFDRGYLSLPGWTKGATAYEWMGSPWLDSGKDIFEINGKKVHHYLILGDDSIVEVISIGEARFQRVDSKRFIEVSHQI